MNRWVALTGSVCAACLAPPGKGDGGGGARDAAILESDAAAKVEADAGPCPIEYRDDFDRDDLGASWTFLGDATRTDQALEEGALVMTATGDGVYAFGALHTAVSWGLTDVVIEAHVDPEPSVDGDTFFGWIEEGGDNYIGLTAANRNRLTIVDGVIGADWVEPCAPSCPELALGPQRWRIRPEGANLVFEYALGPGEWQIIEPRPEPAFASGFVGFWSETDVGMTSNLTVSAVTVATCD